MSEVNELQALVAKLKSGIDETKESLENELSELETARQNLVETLSDRLKGVVSRRSLLTDVLEETQKKLLADQDHNVTIDLGTAQITSFTQSLRGLQSHLLQGSQSVLQSSEVLEIPSEPIQQQQQHNRELQTDATPTSKTVSEKESTGKPIESSNDVKPKSSREERLRRIKENLKQD